MSSRFVKLCDARRAAGKYVCVGLDPDPMQIPSCVPGGDIFEQLYNFLTFVVNATHQYAMCFKLQSSGYEGYGPQGMQVLQDVIEHIHSVDRTIPVILDGKRADTGRSNQGYVAAAFDIYGADALTVHYVHGVKAMQPFLTCTDKTIIVVCRTSNEGSAEFQDIRVQPVIDVVTEKLYATTEHAVSEGAQGPFQFLLHGMPMYEYAARRVVETWNVNSNCAIVVGATQPKELAYLRDVIGDMPMLIPGWGTQGGDENASVKYGFEGGALGIINNSSAITGAYLRRRDENDDLVYTPDQWAQAAGEAARVMNDSIKAKLALVV